MSKEKDFYQFEVSNEERAGARSELTVGYTREEAAKLVEAESTAMTRVEGKKIDFTSIDTWREEEAYDLVVTGNYDGRAHGHKLVKPSEKTRTSK